MGELTFGFTDAFERKIIFSQKIQFPWEFYKNEIEEKEEKDDK